MKGKKWTRMIMFGMKLVVWKITMMIMTHDDDDDDDYDDDDDDDSVQRGRFGSYYSYDYLEINI